jgi:Family of unknown function (DUF5675)
MKLQVVRETFTPKSTIGKLYIGGRFFCYTLEDVDRDKNKDGDLNDAGEQKVYGETAIPRGTYKVTLTMSNRFKVVMPLLSNVAGFEGIRIHNGNTSEHTHGCILVGESKALDFIGGSKMAFAKLMDILSKTKESITIEIK